MKSPLLPRLTAREQAPTCLLIRDDILDVEGGLQPVAVTPVKVLGRGRAAEARLVRVATNTGESITAVEKVFRPGRLTRAIYRIAFQSTFAYQNNADAIKTCFYRRRVAAAVIKAAGIDAAVARPLYVRWDRKTEAMVLGSEYIAGRGIVPAPADLSRVRRTFAERFAGSHSAADAPTEEIKELLPLMRRLESALLDAGLTGSGWQVCTQAVVSTANLLRIGQRYTIVDLESGIPAVLVLRYLLAGLSLSKIPLFDDLDGTKLQRWLDKNHERLQALMTTEEFAQIQTDIVRLISHDATWKNSEPAIFRRPRRLLRVEFWRLWKDRTLADWQRRDVCDAPTHARLAASRRFFSRPAFLVGLIPGGIGRAGQSLLCSQRYRSHISSLLRDRPYRQAHIDRYTLAKRSTWKATGRLAEQAKFAVTAEQPVESGFSPSFLSHLILSKFTPVKLHRWCADGQRRRNSRERLWQLGTSSSFQQEFGQNLVRARLIAWRNSQRIGNIDVALLQRQLDAPIVLRYVRGFGMHAGLKFLTPLVWSVRIAAMAVTAASGSPLSLLLAIMLLPILRTIVTLGQVIGGRQAISDYRDALLVGILPMVGSLAYPIQMYSRFPEISLFLLRDFASRAGRAVPIYGGPDSRTELLAIKSVDLIAESLEIWLWLLGTRRCDHVTQPVPHDLVEVAADVTPPVIPFPHESADEFNTAATPVIHRRVG